MTTRHFFYVCLFTIILGFTLSSLYSKEKVPIRLFLQMSSEEQASNTEISEFIETYNQSQDQIELILDITTAGCSFDAADTLLARIAADKSPDITVLRYQELWDYFLDLKPCLDLYDLSDLDTILFDKFNYHGRQIYYPIAYSTNLLYYNKDLFDLADIAYPPHAYNAPYADGDPWNIQKLEEIAMQLTLDQAGRNANHSEFNSTQIKQYGFHWAWNNGIGFIQPFGPPYLIDAKSDISIPDYMHEGYEWSHDGIWKKHFIPPDPVFVNEMESNPIGSGKCAMVVTGAYYIDNLDSTIHWDIAAMPSYEGVHNISWGISGLAILNTTQYPDEAFEVLMMIANTFDYYAGALSIPTKKSFRQALYDTWHVRLPGVDTQVFIDGLNYLSPISDAEAVQFQMGAWRCLNDFRDYIRSNPAADIDGALNSWLIPLLEPFFQMSLLDMDLNSNDPDQYCLFQNYPNPFNSATTISYELPGPGRVSLEIYDITGRRVATLVNEHHKSGQYKVIFDGCNQASGVYVYQLKSEDFLDTRKFIILK